MPNNKVRIIAEPQAIISLRRNPVFCNSRTLQHIFRNCAEIVLIADEEKFKDYWANLESPIRRFFDAYDMSKPHVVSELMSIYKYPARCSHLDPFAIWLLNKSQEVLYKFQELLGLMAIGPQSLSDDMFSLDHMVRRYHRNIIEGDGNGWENIIDKMKKPFPPLNALVISDEFIFTNKDTDGNIFGVKNLFMLLDAILPLSLKVTFQITILCSHPKLNVIDTDATMRMLRNDFESIRDYPINIDLIYGNRFLHERVLYSNYFNIVSDKGFNIFFWHNDKQLCGHHKITIKTYLNNPFSTGDSEYEVAKNDLNEINRIFSEVQNESSNQETIRLDLQKADIFQNRLLKIDIGADSSHN